MDGQRSAAFCARSPVDRRFALLSPPQLTFGIELQTVPHVCVQGG